MKVIFANSCNQKDVQEQVNVLTGCGAQIADVYIIFKRKQTIIHYILPLEMNQEEFVSKLSGTYIYPDIISIKP